MTTPRFNPPNQILFCTRPWKPMAMVLGTLILGTFLWAFYLLTHFLHEYELSDYALIGTVEGGVSGLVNVGANGAGGVAEQAAPAIVTVIGTAPSGTRIAVASGTVIHPDGYLLTTHHSLAGLKDIAIEVQTNAGPQYYQARVVKTQAQHDLALMKMLTTERFLFLPLARQRSRSGTPVTAVGKDAGGTLVTGRGTVIRATRGLTIGGRRMTHLLQTQAISAWQQGGGPLLGGTGEVAGINLVVRGADGARRGYAVPSEVVLTHFQDLITFPTGRLRGQGSADAGSWRKLATAWWGRARDQQNSVAVSPPPVPGGMQPAAAGAAPGAVAAKPDIMRAGRPTHIGDAGDRVTLVDLERDSGFNIGGFTLDSIFGLALLGVVSGIVGALMPMGGSILVITGLMMLFGYGLFLIRPIIYITNLFTYGLSLLRYMKQGLIMRRTVMELLPWVLVGVGAGYFIGHNLPDHLVGVLLGMFAVAAATVATLEAFGRLPNIDPLVNPAPNSSDARVADFLAHAELEQNKPRSASLANALIMGLPLGLITGILGLSGGVTETFYQRWRAGLSAENAIANTAALVFAASAAAAIVSFVHGTAIDSFSWQTPLTLAMVLIPATYAGGIVGANMQKNWSLLVRRTLFAAVMLAVAATMFFAQ